MATTRLPLNLIEFVNASHRTVPPIGIKGLSCEACSAPIKLVLRGIPRQVNKDSVMVRTWAGLLFAMSLTHGVFATEVDREFSQIDRRIGKQPKYSRVPGGRKLQ